MTTNFSDNSDSDSSNSYEDHDEKNQKIAIIEAIEERLETWKNPKEITIDINVDEKNRDEFYKKMHNIERNKILSMFIKCGDIKELSQNYFLIFSIFLFKHKNII